MSRIASFSLAIILILLGGCGTVPTPQERQKTLNALAADENLSISIIHTTHFSLSSIVSSQCENKVMRVYIEGDGLSWITSSRLSDNPTPINPLAAKLMKIDPSGCKAYLARPCQYTNDTQCNQEYWSNRRFSPEVIESYTQALDTLKKHYDINTFTLIGYSGGGAVAALSAAMRNDVTLLITVAGNLDTDKWVQIHDIATLSGSLNPADFTSRLEHISQIHLIGKQDTVIPKEVFISYRNRFKNKELIQYYEVNATHHDGLEKEYQIFLTKVKQ